MTFALTAALIFTVLAFLWFTDRQGARQTAERASHRAEVAALLQRIQAPERAVTQHEIADVEVDMPQEPKNDAEHWKLSREHEEFIAALERAENAPFDRVS